METDPAPESQKTQTPKGTFSTAILIVIALAIAGYAGFLVWQKFSMDRENEKFLTSIKNTSEQIKRLAGSTDPEKKMQIAQIFERAKASRVLWSTVVYEVLRLENPDIRFVNFSSNREQEISVDGLAKDLESVATLLETLRFNSRIQNPFVSSISEFKPRKPTDLPSQTDKKFRFQLTFDFINQVL